MNMNMKMKMFLTILAILAVGLVHGATITVTQPSGGTVTMGGPMQIMWTAVDVASNVRILLRRPGGALVATLATGLAGQPRALRLDRGRPGRGRRNLQGPRPRR